jgi:hypothetical protein
MKHKTSGVIDSAAKMLVGNRAGLSSAQKKFVDSYVGRHGAVRTDLKNNRGFLKSIILGNENAIPIAKARYMQGGLVGKGGLIRGELAPSDEYISSAKKLKNYLLSDAGSPTDFSSSDAKTLLTGSPMAALNIGFNVGFPAMEAAKAMRGESEEFGDRKGSGVGAALGSGLGFLLSSNFGLPAGMVASYIGKNVGQRAGSLFDKKQESTYDQTMGLAERALM